MIVHPEPGDRPAWMDEAFQAVLGLNLPTPGWEFREGWRAAARWFATDVRGQG